LRRREAAIGGAGSPAHPQERPLKARDRVRPCAAVNSGVLKAPPSRLTIAGLQPRHSIMCRAGWTPAPKESKCLRACSQTGRQGKNELRL